MNFDWDATFRRESTRLERFFRRRLRQTDDAPDLVASTFQRAIEKQDQVRDSSAIRGWLFMIARRLLADDYRRVRRDLPIDELETTVAAPDAAVAQRELERAIAAALQGLTPRERKLLRLKFHERRSNKEIAASMRLSDANVAKICYRAVLALRIQLRDWRPDDVR